MAPEQPWDVFISYKRGGDTESWLKAHFRDRLQRRLNDAAGRPTRIFVDEDMGPGTRWREHVGAALQRSRLVIALLSRSYFESPWCRAELEMVLAREKLLRDQGKAVSLLFPLQCQDGKHYDPVVKERIWLDFSAWLHDTPAFLTVGIHIDFASAVQRLGDELAERLDQIDGWTLPQVPLPAIFEDTPATDPLLPRIEQP